jgi:hypothetical protein
VKVKEKFILAVKFFILEVPVNKVGKELVIVYNTALKKTMRNFSLDKYYKKT